MWSGNKAGYSDQHKMIMYALAEQSVITENVFSFFLTGEAGDSYIDFGTPNTAAMSAAEDLVWIDVIDDNDWWTANV